MNFALLAPMLLMLICGGIDLAAVNADHTSMQDTADATALAMARQLGTDPQGIPARAQAFALAQLGSVGQQDQVTITATVSANNAVTVQISGHRNSFFGDLLPPGGWTMAAAATASALGEEPLCALSYGAAGGENLHLTGNSQLTAASCLVQSNGDIKVDNNGVLVAGTAQAVGSASGSITPSPQTGAPAIPDPFATLDVSIPANTCTPTNITYASGVNELAPGVHCGNITADNGATIELMPGEHYFVQGQLQLQQSATLTGSDVVLIFDKSSNFNFADSSVVTLAGRKTGPYAGFVIATTRTNTGTFSISSTSAKQLEGTIYIPAAALQVQGTGNKVAQQSAWTVVVAQSIQLNGSADLVINANYASSSVPVPSGVGNQATVGSVTLSQ
ncbi:MAG TPA: pilus assembly protein TadG-related protein [Caulobacteraceae bacterium]|nr:pilus assembly protein TadG-related protein [Caulobacteraceae bacterium]